MFSPDSLDRLANRQEKQGRSVFLKALNRQLAILADLHENGKELKINSQTIKTVLQDFHVKVQIENAQWQYTYLEKQVGAKALQIGAYDRILRAIRAWVLLNTGESISSITATTLERVRSIIARGQEEGYGARKVAQLIRADRNSEFTRYRSELIARTEGTRAASHGHKLGAEQWEQVTGQKKWKIWSASKDSRTRDAHRAMIGAPPIPGDQDFIVGGAPMDAPGDPKGGAANVIACRCRAVYVSERIARRIINGEKF